MKPENATFVTDVYVSRNGQPTLVGYVWRVRHQDKPDEWWLEEWPSLEYKRIGEY